MLSGLSKMSEILWLDILIKGVPTSYFQVPALTVSVILFYLYLLFFIIIYLLFIYCSHCNFLYSVLFVKSYSAPLCSASYEGGLRSHLTKWHKYKQHHSLFLHFERYLTDKKAVSALVTDLLFLFWGRSQFSLSPC